MSDHVLEPAAQEFADATATPPFLYELGPEGARKVLDDVQAAPIDKLDVDVITFEAADNGGDEIESFAAGIGKDKKIAIGVISHRTLQVERPEEVATLIRRALKVIPPERLIVSTDCGFGRQGMSRLHAFYKMVSLVRGTNLVRRELGLPEADILAADPQGSLIS